MSDDLSIPSPTYRIPRRRHGMDPGTRRLALIAGGLGGALLVIVGGWSMIGHRSTSVPVMQADNRPIRVKPDNPGGLQVAGANEDILSGGTETKGGKLAPPPEAPAPQALRNPQPPPVAAAAQAVRNPPSPPVATVPAAASPPVPAAAPAAKPPVATTAEKPAPASAADKHPGTPAAASRALVQLAAVSSEEAAKSEWQRLSKRLPDLLGAHKPALSKTEHDGKTLWRVRTGGFDDAAQATSFCEKVRAKGAACLVAEF